MNALQELIQRRMAELGIKSWSELGRRAGLPRSTVWALGTTERRHSMPKDTTLADIAVALGVGVEDLRAAAYRALGAVRHVDETRGEVRIVGADFEVLTEQEQEELNQLVRQRVQEKQET